MIVNRSNLMNTMTHSVTKVTVAGALVAGAAVLAVNGAAAAAPAPTSGAVQLLSTQSGHQPAYDVVTGAINDYGKDVPIGRNTHKVILKKGTFQIDATKLNKHIKFKPSRVGCSSIASGSASALPVSHGTGAYAGITGSLTIDVRFTQIGKVVNGKCTLSKGLAYDGVVIGTGHVSY
jgi:hypothetical protein